MYLIHTSMYMYILTCIWDDATSSATKLYLYGVCRHILGNLLENWQNLILWYSLHTAPLFHSNRLSATTRLWAAFKKGQHGLTLHISSWHWLFKDLILQNDKATGRGGRCSWVKTYPDLKFKCRHSSFISLHVYIIYPLPIAYVYTVTFSVCTPSIFFAYGLSTFLCISALSTLFCLCSHTVNFLCLTCRFFCVHTQPIFSAHTVNFLCLTCYFFYMNTFFCVHIDRHTLHIFRLQTVNFSAFTFFCVQPRIFSVCIHCQLLRVHTTANFNVYTYYQFSVFSPSPQKICVQTAT